MDERLRELNEELSELNGRLARAKGWSGGWTICGPSRRSGRPG